jgi:hypothetical protein
MTKLTDDILQFASLNRAPGAMWPEATKRKAPHKPILLLAVLFRNHLICRKMVLGKSVESGYNRYRRLI